MSKRNINTTQKNYASKKINIFASEREKKKKKKIRIDLEVNEPLVLNTAQLTGFHRYTSAK